MCVVHASLQLLLLVIVKNIQKRPTALSGNETNLPIAATYSLKSTVSKVILPSS